MSRRVGPGRSGGRWTGAWSRLTEVSKAATGLPDSKQRGPRPDPLPGLPQFPVELLRGCTLSAARSGSAETLAWMLSQSPSGKGLHRIVPASSRMASASRLARSCLFSLRPARSSDRLIEDWERKIDGGVEVDQGLPQLSLSFMILGRGDESMDGRGLGLALMILQEPKGRDDDDECPRQSRCRSRPRRPTRDGRTAAAGIRATRREACRGLQAADGKSRSEPGVPARVRAPRHSCHIPDRRTPRP